MTWTSLLPVLVPITSLVTGLTIFFLHERRWRLRTALNLGGAVVNLSLVMVIIWGASQQEFYEFRMPLVPNHDLILRADALAALFAMLSASLWLITTIYAIGYLEGSPHRSRFFGFFSLSMTATAGISMSGNLLTFFIFYEFLTLVTYPLIVHRGTPVAKHAGWVYLAYSLIGGVALLIGISWLYGLGGSLEFTPGGFAEVLVDDHRTSLIAIFALLITGLGVKAALVPLHGWLPIAMVAPAPVSALLHAVAVVKAGAFGIVRVVNDVFGVEFAQQLGVLFPLAVAASITILYGSFRALMQDDLKRRLAYSTVSQVSYVTLGVAIGGPLATIGGIAHLVHQGLMKITLFFCAGNVAETLGVHKISEMRGVGHRMPWTMGAFTVGALGMIGIPPIAGFFSKWFLAAGGLEAGATWVIAVLIGSSLLNAAYFLPVLRTVWFDAPEKDWPAIDKTTGLETRWMLLLPTVTTATMALGAGILASMPFSPLQWARMITVMEYMH